LKGYDYKNNLSKGEIQKLTDNNKEKETIDILFEKYLATDVSFIIKRLMDIDIQNLKSELLSLQEKQNDLGAGFHGFVPEVIQKDLEFPNTESFSSLLEISEKLLEIKENYKPIIKKSGFPLTFTRIKEFTSTKTNPSPNIKINIDLQAVNLLVNLLEREEDFRGLIDEIVNLKAIKNMLNHRKDLGYIPDPLMTRENLKLVLTEVKKATPINKIWMWLNPWNFFNIADYYLHLEEFKYLITYLKENKNLIQKSVGNRLTGFCPKNLSYSDEFAVTFEWGIRGWATNEMAGGNLEFFKNEIFQLTSTIIHEIYHRIQLSLLTNKKEKDFELITNKDIGNKYDEKFYEALSYIYLEGSASFVGGVNQKMISSENVNEGVELFKDLYEMLYINKDLKESEEIINSGLISNGPFYSLGYKLTEVIVKSYGTMETYHELIQEPLNFFIKCFDCIEKNFDATEIQFNSRIKNKILALQRKIH
jgi:hypothetical protein